MITGMSLAVRHLWSPVWTLPLWTVSLACGGASTAAREATAAATSGRPVAAVLVSVELERAERGNAESLVSLRLTDQNGASNTREVGSFGPDCVEAKIPPGQKIAGRPVLVGVDCVRGGVGLQLRMVHRLYEIVVLRARIDPDTELSYDEHARIELPAGAAVRVGRGAVVDPAVLEPPQGRAAPEATRPASDGAPAETGLSPVPSSLDRPQDAPPPDSPPAPAPGAPPPDSPPAPAPGAPPPGSPPAAPAPAPR
jgi:hypothetical protein